SHAAVLLRTHCQLEDEVAGDSGNLVVVAGWAVTELAPAVTIELAPAPGLSPPHHPLQALRAPRALH
ncbi:hypothetical protein E2562_002922, partial [Oryza meyeriana var. granulata]